jgi:regulator of RNase E activity RraA
MVAPGYIVVGDEDGVVFIDPHDAPELTKKTKAHNDKERDTFAKIQAGTLDRRWVDQALKEKGCEFI